MAADRFRLAGALRAALDFLHGFVDTKLPRLNIVLPQGEQLAGPEAAVDENPQHQVFSPVRLGDQPLDLFE